MRTRTDLVSNRLAGAYALTSRLSLAFESFGEIQDMADGTSFNEQEHSIGPAFYYTIRRG